MRIRPVALALIAVLGLAACGTGAASETVLVESTTPAAEPQEETVTVPAEHLRAVQAYWDEREAAFAAGAQHGVTFIVERLPAGLDYSVSDCMQAWFGDLDLDGFAERNVLDSDSVAPSDDWVMTIGAREIAPGPDVYRMEVELSYDGTPGWWPDRRVAAYLQVDGGTTRNFVRCETAQVAAAAPAPALRGDGAPPALPGETLVRTVSVRSLMAEDETVTAAGTPECPNPRIEVRNDTAFIFCPRPAPDAPRPGEPGAPPPPPAEPSGTRPPGTGLDFCRGEGDGREQAGDYYACGYDEQEPRATD